MNDASHEKNGSSHRQPVSRSEDQPEQADDDEQTDHEYDTDRATNELQHNYTSLLVAQAVLGLPEVFLNLAFGPILLAAAFGFSPVAGRHADSLLCRLDHVLGFAFGTGFMHRFSSLNEQRH
jgi:hypothetical protein